MPLDRVAPPGALNSHILSVVSMSEGVSWEEIRILGGVLIALGLGVGGFVATIVWWLANIVRANDKALVELREECSKMDAITRHALRNEMQREVSVNDANDEARRKEISDIIVRIVRIESRLNGRLKG